MTADTPLLVGVDIGTSGCKAVVLGADGTVRGAGRARISTRSEGDGGMTQRPDDWVVSLENAVREALATTDSRCVVGLAITAPAYNAVLLDGQGLPTGDIVLWSDPRPRADAEELRERYGDQLLADALVDIRTGTTAAQLRWIRRARPEQWKRTRHVLIGKDYVRFVLTGDRAIDPTNAASTGLFDPRTMRWLVGLAAEIGVDPGALPPVRRSDDVATTVTDDWAARLGLRPGTPVAVGGNDTACELLSVGAIMAGTGVVKVASSGTVVVVDDAPHSGVGLLTFPHLDSSKWYTLAATNTAGTALSWLTSNVLGMPARPAEIHEVEASASRVVAGSEGLMAFPWVTGERCPLWDPDVRGVFVGASTRHHQGHFARAVIEGAAFALRECWDHLARSGLAVRQPWLTGGGLRSELWRSIVLAVLNSAAQVVSPCEPALGAALVAARGVGLDVQVQRNEAKHLQPDQALAKTYAKLLDGRRALAPVLAEISRRAPY